MWTIVSIGSFSAFPAVGWRVIGAENMKALVHCIKKSLNKQTLKTPSGPGVQKCEWQIVEWCWAVRDSYNGETWQHNALQYFMCWSRDLQWTGGKVGAWWQWNREHSGDIQIWLTHFLLHPNELAIVGGSTAKSGLFVPLSARLFFCSVYSRSCCLVADEAPRDRLAACGVDFADKPWSWTRLQHSSSVQNLFILQINYV